MHRLNVHPLPTMTPFLRPPCHKPFPDPPTWAHVVANALAILRADLRRSSIDSERIRQDTHSRIFLIERRYTIPSKS